jgi:hypothetical protein
MLRSRKVWLGIIFACLVMLALMLGWPGTRTSNAQVPTTGDVWQKVHDVSADIDFRNVFMASSRSGIAVGKQVNKGAAYELEWMPLDGWRNLLQITPVAFNFRAPLWAAVMVNQDVWVVGEQGLIVREHNGIWGEVPSPVPDAQLLALQMLGNGDEGWAGGLRPRPGFRPEPVILHYTNGKWQRDDTIKGEGTINALHVAQGGGWAVGDADIWRYYNGQWTQEQPPNPCPEAGCFETYNAVRAIRIDEAWIAGSRIGLCGICVPSPYLLHREADRWQIVVDGSVLGDPTRPGAGRELYGLTFTDFNPNVPMLGWAVGTIRDNDRLEPYILSHSSLQAPSEWNYVPYPADVNTQLTSVSTSDMEHAVAVGTGGAILSYGYGPQPPPTLTPTPTSATVSSPTPTPTASGGANPAHRVPDLHNPKVTYFALVGHTLGGGFRDYWERHGGLAQFGYPLTEEFSEISSTDGKPYVTQYFERARFEYHPENRPPYDVLLGLLGRAITKGREGEVPFRRTPAQVGPGTLYFDATGHNVPPQFSTYWLQHGGLPVYGYPISEAFQELSPTDNKLYLVQYFELNRFEYHHYMPEPYQVSLCLLGVQLLQQRGWIP